MNQKNLSLKRQTVTIRANPADVQIRALVYGQLAVHRAINAQGYSITHVASGYSVSHENKFCTACAIAYLWNRYFNYDSVYRIMQRERCFHIPRWYKLSLRIRDKVRRADNPQYAIGWIISDMPGGQS